MATMTLRILQPIHDQVFVGDPPPPVRFEGELVDVPPELARIPLYFRWYSSLNKEVAYSQQDANQRRYSLNQSALRAANIVYSKQLFLGSHVIAFAASDRAGETDADFQEIRHGTATGGDKDLASRCIIHILQANIFDLTTTPVSRSRLRLKAEAPWAWGNADYHDYNQLRYRWILKPFNPPGRLMRRRAELEFLPSLTDLSFTAATQNTPAFVEFTPSLPQGAAGAYDITLFVEDRLDPVPARQAISAPQRVNLLP